MGDAPLSRAAFEGLLDDLRHVADAYVHGDETFTDTDVVEGYSLMTSLLSGAIEHRLASDPERPLFTPIVSPVRKFLGDNADALYQWTRIRGDRAYRVRGRLTGETYLSFTVHGPDPAGGAGQRVITDLSDRSFTVATDGSYELLVGPDPPSTFTRADVRIGDGQWIRTEPDAESLLTRHYFARPVSAGADPTCGVELSIEPLVDPGPPEPPTDPEMADRLAAVGRFVRAETSDRVPPADVPFVSREPNLLPTPALFRSAELDTVGAVDIFYAMCPFVLGPDDALVMTGRLPEGPFSNVVLWNRHMQTLDYRHRTTSLNDAQMSLTPDRSYRIAVSATNPGPGIDWLDTEGRAVGIVFWRFLLPESDPDRPHCEVVPLGSLRE